MLPVQLAVAANAVPTNSSPAATSVVRSFMFYLLVNSWDDGDSRGETRTNAYSSEVSVARQVAAGSATIVVMPSLATGLGLACGLPIPKRMTETSPSQSIRAVAHDRVKVSRWEVRTLINSQLEGEVYGYSVR